MFEDSCFIFPTPAYQNIQLQLGQIRQHLIFIPRANQSINNSLHLQELKIISKSELAKRFLDNTQNHQESQHKNYNRNNPSKYDQQLPFHVLKPLRKLIKLKKTSQIVKNSKTKEIEQKEKLFRKLNLFQAGYNFRQTLSSFSTKITTARNNEDFQCLTSRQIKQRKLPKIALNSQMIEAENLNLSLRQNQIPCLYIKSEYNIKQNLFIYYHANAEDLINSYFFVQQLSKYFGIDLLVVQYPGYSIYQPSELLYQNHRGNCSEYQTKTAQILADIPCVLQHVTHLGYNLEKVFVIGRSIGSGPAIQIGASYKIGALILISPFAEFSEVVEQLCGKLIGVFSPKLFDNIDQSGYIKCPVLLIHGLKDKTISYKQSLKLLSRIKSFCNLKLIEKMTHNKFDYERDIFENIECFFGCQKIQKCIDQLSNDFKMQDNYLFDMVIQGKSFLFKRDFEL